MHFWKNTSYQSSHLSGVDSFCVLYRLVTLAICVIIMWLWNGNRLNLFVNSKFVCRTTTSP